MGPGDSSAAFDTVWLRGLSFPKYACLPGECRIGIFAGYIPALPPPPTAGVGGVWVGGRPPTEVVECAFVDRGRFLSSTVRESVGPWAEPFSGSTHLPALAEGGGGGSAGLRTPTTPPPPPGGLRPTVVKGTGLRSPRALKASDGPQAPEPYVRICSTNLKETYGAV